MGCRKELQTTPEHTLISLSHPDPTHTNITLSFEFWG